MIFVILLLLGCLFLNSRFPIKSTHNRLEVNLYLNQTAQLCWSWRHRNTNSFVGMKLLQKCQCLARIDTNVEEVSPLTLCGRMISVVPLGCHGYLC